MPNAKFPPARQPPRAMLLQTPRRQGLTDMLKQLDAHLENRRAGDAPLAASRKVRPHRFAEVSGLRIGVLASAHGAPDRRGEFQAVELLSLSISLEHADH